MEFSHNFRCYGMDGVTWEVSRIPTGRRLSF